MKLFSILIFKWDQQQPALLSSHVDVSSVNFFMRNTVKEYILFNSRLICSRTGVNERQTVQFPQELGCCHAYVHPSGLAGTVLTDQEYPQRVAFSLLNQALRAFYEKHPDAWLRIQKDTLLPFPDGDELLKTYQNPVEADKLLKIQRDLDEVPSLTRLLYILGTCRSKKSC